MPSLPGLPSIPGLETLIELTRSQVQIMQQIPGVLIALNTTLSTLADTLQQSQEAFASVSKVSQRMDGMLDEIEEPVIMMGPGLRRLAVALDDPMITAVPDMIRTVRDDLGPQMRQIIVMQHNIQQSATQVVGGLADATKALGAIPGLGKIPGLLTARPTRPSADDAEVSSGAETGAAAEASASSAPAAARKTTRSTSSRSGATRSTRTTKAPAESESAPE